MPLDVDVRALNLADVLGEIEEREDRAEDLRPAYSVFDRAVNTWVRKQFRSEGRHGGERWKPLKPSTVRSRTALSGESARTETATGANRGPAGPEHPLWRFGLLRASLIEVGGQGFRRISRKRYVRGTRIPYAPHVGAPDGPRPIFPDPWPRNLRDKMEESLRGYMEDGLAGALSRTSGVF